jgi:hypothetical protein
MMMMMMMMIATKDFDILDRPYFGENIRNITTSSNQTVILKCTVKNRGNRTVRYQHEIHINHKENLL